MKEIPFYHDQILYFENGKLNLNFCTLQEVMEIFSCPNPEVLYSEDFLHVLFENEQAEVKACFMPDQDLNKQSIVQSLIYELKKPVFLFNIQENYQMISYPLKIYIEEQTEHYEIFSLNLLVSLNQDKTIKTIEYVNANHVRTCSCDFCQAVISTIAISN